MKQAIFFIGIGILTIIGGINYNEYRLIPEFLYYVFGAVAIIFGIYKLFTDTSDIDEPTS